MSGSIRTAATTAATTMTSTTSLGVYAKAAGISRSCRAWQPFTPGGLPPSTSAPCQYPDWFAEAYAEAFAQPVSERRGPTPWPGDVPFTPVLAPHNVDDPSSSSSKRPRLE